MGYKWSLDRWRHVTPQWCCETVRPAIPATAWLLASNSLAVYSRCRWLSAGVGYASSFRRSHEASDSLASALSASVLRHGDSAPRHAQPLHRSRLSSQDRCASSARAGVLEQARTEWVCNGNGQLAKIQVFCSTSIPYPVPHQTAKLCTH